jgi:acyl-CoA thioester hydrolase
MREKQRMNLDGFHFHTTVRVRYAETDAQNVVYYANYLTYMEIARWDYVRSLDRPFDALRDFWQRHFTVEVHCSYKSPARFNDVLELHARVARIGNSSFDFEYAFVKQEGGQLIATGQTVHVLLDSDHEGARPERVPEDLRAAIAEREGWGRDT